MGADAQDFGAGGGGVREADGDRDAGFFNGEFTFKLDKAEDVKGQVTARLGVLATGAVYGESFVTGRAGENRQVGFAGAGGAGDVAVVDDAGVGCLAVDGY